MTLIEVTNAGMEFAAGPIWARRHVHALRDISLAIEPGEIIGVVGESGSGKSTLGNICIGRYGATAGSVLYKGQPMAEIPRRDRMGKFAAVLQHPKWSLNPMLRVRNSIAEPMRVNGTAGSRAEVVRKVGEMLEHVGLPGNYQDRFPGELSGGQRQRVSIARALITRPEFVLFDEAVSALDVSVQSQVLNLIKELQTQDGFSAIFISHDLAATRYVASRIAVLYAGRLVEDAPAQEFYKLALHPYSQGLQYASGLTDLAALELSLGQVALDAPGCPLAGRCPKVMDVCREMAPDTISAAGHRVACHQIETG